MEKKNSLLMHQAFELNIFITGDKCTDEYVGLLINSFNLDPLSWKIYQFQDGFNENFISKFKNQELIQTKAVVICITGSMSSPNAKTIIESLNNLDLLVDPFIIFVTLSKVDDQLSFQAFIEQIQSADFYQDSRQFSLLHYSKDDLSPLIGKLFDICCYYNQLGNTLIFPGRTNEEEMNKYLFTINIIVVGKPGAGKSTLINHLLNEFIAKEYNGFSQSSKTVEYYHKKYPLVFYDTPGFNTSNQDNILNFINNHSLLNPQCIQSKQLQLIVYVINSAIPYQDEEFEFLLKLKKNSNLPIFYVLTRAKGYDTLSNSKKLFEFEIQFSKILNRNWRDFALSVDLVKPYFGIEFCVDQMLSIIFSSTFKEMIKNENIISIDSIMKHFRQKMDENKDKPIPNIIKNEAQIKREITSIYRSFGIIIEEEVIDQVVKTAKELAENDDNLNKSNLDEDIIINFNSNQIQNNFQNYMNYISKATYKTIEIQYERSNQMINKIYFLKEYYTEFHEKIVKEMTNYYSHYK